jgi:hypothetical protein
MIDFIRLLGFVCCPQFPSFFKLFYHNYLSARHKNSRRNSSKKLTAGASQLKNSRPRNAGIGGQQNFHRRPANFRKTADPTFAHGKILFVSKPL